MIIFKQIWAPVLRSKRIPDDNVKYITRIVHQYIGDNLDEKEIKNYYEDKIFGDMAASHILISVDVKEL